MLGQNFWFIQIKYKKSKTTKKSQFNVVDSRQDVIATGLSTRGFGSIFQGLLTTAFISVYFYHDWFFFFSFSFFSLSSYYLLLYFIFTFYCFLFLIVFPLSITFFLSFWSFYFSFRSLSSSPLSPFLPPPLSLFSLYFLSINTILDNGNDNSHVVIVMYICNLLSS